MRSVRSGASPAARFEFASGRLCLDFINTVRSRPLSVRVDLINEYEDLILWSHRAGIVTSAETAELAEGTRRQPRAAAGVLGRARRLREALYRIFSARAGGLPVPAPDVRAINRAIAQAMARAELVQSGGAFEWRWTESPPRLDRMVSAVARSAAELLTSKDLTSVRECDGYDCGRLFIDVTKNRSRRWCDMATCGNRAKGRRHYERRRSATGPAASGTR
jgi:predicted RNA-binding Zn ribbon-like protein